MKAYFHLTIMLLLCLGFQTTYGQVDTIASKYVNTASNISESVKTAKALWGSLPTLPKKAKDTVFVLVTNISLAEPNLDLLKSSISKGKDNLRYSFQDGIVILKVFGKKNSAGKIYDGLDAPLKKIFNVADMEDARMVLEYKAPPAK